MVIFLAGEAPIRGTQILYFQDPVFSRRATIPPPVSGSTTRPAMAFSP
jgi:type IV secretion system protein VirD4